MDAVVSWGHNGLWQGVLAIGYRVVRSFDTPILDEGDDSACVARDWLLDNHPEYEWLTPTEAWVKWTSEVKESA